MRSELGRVGISQARIFSCKTVTLRVEDLTPRLIPHATLSQVAMMGWEGSTKAEVWLILVVVVYETLASIKYIESPSDFQQISVEATERHPTSEQRFQPGIMTSRH